MCDSCNIRPIQSDIRPGANIKILHLTGAGHVPIDQPHDFDMQTKVKLDKGYDLLQCLFPY
jgi:hypothetical protein